jgi:RHH-type transcriptional regulator, rel operon repressor / antitoxin RelB
MTYSVRLPIKIEQRLSSLAKKTGRTKSFFIRKAIEKGLADTEDYYLAAAALARVRNGQERLISSTEVRRRLKIEES